MSLLTELYQDVRTEISWHESDTSTIASFGNCRIEFITDSNGFKIYPLTEITGKSANTVASAISTIVHKHAPHRLVIDTGNCNETDYVFEYAFSRVSSMYGYGMELGEGTLSIGDDVEELYEEPNSSLQHHRMFPNKRINAELESYGYTFRDGGGSKLMHKHMGSTNRNSGPHKHRTMQNIVILKDGRMYRKITKAKWNQLVDPSDKDSESWGVTFQRKLIKHERQLRTDQGIEIHYK